MGAITTARAGARAVARHAALDALSILARTGDRQERALAVPRVQFPYLHALPAEEEDTFRRLLAGLARTHTFIGYSEAVDRVLTSRVDRPYLAFSFDDGFASNVRTAAILEEFGTVGCFFVPTDVIGSASVAEARAVFGYARCIDEPAMTWADLERLKTRGHEVGSHTRRHRRLSDLSPAGLEDEVAGAADELRRRLGSAEHFAWPFGKFADFSGDALEVVRRSGHRSCASAERGVHLAGYDAKPEQLCIRRDGVMTSWPVRHTRYLLARSATARAQRVQTFPAHWRAGAA